MMGQVYPVAMTLEQIKGATTGATMTDTPKTDIFDPRMLGAKMSAMAAGGIV